MVTTSSVLVLVAAFQVARGQDNHGYDPRTEPRYDPLLERIPKHCWFPPPGTNPFECCPLPRLYSDEALDSCGIPKPPEGQDISKRPPPGGPPPGGHHGGPHGGPPRPPPDRECTRSKCLMKTNDLLNEDESINYEKLGNFVDDWAQNNPNFTEAIAAAKEQCIKDDSVIGAPHICDHDKVFMCLKSTIIWNCNFREDLEQCTLLREHMEECRPHFFKDPDTEKPE